MDQVCLSGIEVGACYIRTHISPDVPYHVCSLLCRPAFCHALIIEYWLINWLIDWLNKQYTFRLYFLSSSCSCIYNIRGGSYRCKNRLWCCKYMNYLESTMGKCTVCSINQSIFVYYHCCRQSPFSYLLHFVWQVWTSEGFRNFCVTLILCSLVMWSPNICK